MEPERYSWYFDNNDFPYNKSPWFVRGGSYTFEYDGSGGAFGFLCDDGYGSVGTSARAVISNLN